MRTQVAISRDADGPFELEDAELEDPRSDELVVRLVATGICHTDLVSRRIAPPGVPAVLGHEGAGVVEHVGDQVSDIRVGDTVLLSFASCGSCAFCRSDRSAYCQQFGRLNMGGSRPDGSSTLTQDGSPIWSSFFGQSSFARHAITTAQQVVVVPDDTDLVSNSPMGCGFQTGAGAVVNVMQPNDDSSLVVFGVGGVGIAAVMAARAIGVERIIAVDLSPERLALAARLGASHTIDGASPDVVDEIKNHTSGGATYGLDTTAAPEAVRSAARALGPNGTLVLVGVGAPEVTFDVMDLIASGKTVRGCIEGDANPTRLIPLMLQWQSEGCFPTGDVVTTFPFERINDAASVGAGAIIKPVLTF